MTFVDCSGLRTLLEGRARLAERDISLVIRHLPPQARRLFTLAVGRERLEELLGSRDEITDLEPPTSQLIHTTFDHGATAAAFESVLRTWEAATRYAELGPSASSRSITVPPA